MGEWFKLSLGLKQQLEGDDPPAPVYFKVDGARFDAEKTIKVNVEAKYELSFTFRPPQSLRTLSIEGISVKTEERSRDETHATYAASWSTMGIDHNKSGNRKPLPIIFELEENSSLSLSLQMKLYPAKEKQHSHWGNPLSHIEYDCQKTESSSFISINKETFR